MSGFTCRAVMIERGDTLIPRSCKRCGLGPCPFLGEDGKIGGYEIGDAPIGQSLATFHSRTDKLAYQFRHDPNLVADTIAALRLAGRIMAVEVEKEVDPIAFEQTRDQASFGAYVTRGLVSAIGDELQTSRAVKFTRTEGKRRFEPTTFKATLEVLVE